MEPLNLYRLLESNPYPGRGIVLGRSADNRFAVAAYFIMGRSENSRNRIFVPTEDGICTQAHDPSKMTDPSLIIYHPVRQAGRELVVTNGDQTDTVRDYLLAGKTFAQALHTREFEPDAPNYTPRVSGLLSPDGSFQLSILKSADGDPGCCCRYFYHYDRPLPGEGRFIHTYMGDGDPLPSFQGEPERVILDAPGAEELADRMWAALNGENKVSLFVRYAALADGICQDVIRNKHV
ncbi:IMP cyclohydrolase [Oscillibacter sp.]|jgi:IMP cyclohydrolase|uniref:IMP cyclohydrolase n=1 Tax=Oscillibacter sp. TaxID=1945593 RepID=UPI00216D5C49|nr:IMP cyclohydrolase [Oscillibacter sp.]MCI9649825.1 inosine monophosphate cyclohydrolase [Oscillibacter sp.]